MTMKFQIVIFVSSLVAVALAQQRPVPPAFSRSTAQGRAVAPFELEPHQQVPQPFRRVSLPLYRGRGFSLEVQDPKPVAPVQQSFQPRPAVPNENTEFVRTGNNEFSRVGNNEDTDADVPQPIRQVPPQQQQVERGQQQQVERGQQQQQGDRVQQQHQQIDRTQQQHQQIDRTQQQHQQIDRTQQQHQQIDRTQHQQIDKTQNQHIDRTQQQQPEKHLPGFRPQFQIKPVETQPQFVRKVVQKPLKRVQVAEETAAVSKSPEMIQKFKLERSESADKQRAKKPVSQVLRRYRDDNPDGSITWGFENDDGTFKEETIGVDCVTRGKYGYVDPEGVKREYSYQSGVPCDKDRKPTGASAAGDSSAVQDAQASDSYGYIDYTKNQYVMANGQTINLNGMAKNRARKPVVRKTVTSPAPARDDY